MICDNCLKEVGIEIENDGYQDLCKECYDNKYEENFDVQSGGNKFEDAR